LAVCDRAVAQCQAAIDLVADEIMGVDLSHISVSDLMARSLVSTVLFSNA
jgi:hypothetical protein